MRGIAVALIALALMAVPLAIASTAAASSNLPASSAQTATPVFVGPTPTNRFGGGDWVGVTAGSVHFGVVYGTPASPNEVVIFAEYPRVLGGADVVNQQGQQVAVRGIPVDTVLGQSLDRLIEFRTLNVTDGFGLFSDSGLPMMTTVNEPVKAITLRSGAWNMTSESYEMVGTTFYVNFTIEAKNLLYTWVNPMIPNANGTGDRVLEDLAFTFHLTVDTANKSASLPWYRVTVTDTTPREVTNVSFIGYHTVSGPTVQMGAKYDHVIQGWDFLNLTDRLALETHLVIGNFVPDRTVDFVHLAYAQERAEDGANATILDNETAVDAPSAPHLYTFSKITFDDQWTRIGEFRWTSNVTVDGVQKTMLFQVEGGSRIVYSNGENAFYGFMVHGAFIYPAGTTIVHDPAMSVESFTPTVVSGFNLTPLGILLIQVAVVGVAIIPALYLRSRARRPKA